VYIHSGSSVSHARWHRDRFRRQR